MVGSYIKKRIDLALKALSDISHSFVLTIVGKGPENRLIYLSKELFGKGYKKNKFAGHHFNLKNSI